MNTIKTYIGHGGAPAGFEKTKQQLEFEVAVLVEVVQALIDRIAEKENIQIGVMRETASSLKFSLYEKRIEPEYGAEPNEP